MEETDNNQEVPYRKLGDLQSHTEIKNPVIHVELINELPGVNVTFAAALLIEHGSKVSIDDQITFWEELTQLKHENVILFYKVVTNPHPFVLQELVQKNYLDVYLKKNSDLECEALIKFCEQVAKGMEYLLTGYDIVLGKIAAKNCLFDKGDIVKIVDFSMWMIQRKKGGKFPEYARETDIIRWWASECFKKNSVATVKTDVWAFGVTMWEIFTFCENMPYDEMNIENLTEDAVKGPERKLLSKPSNCPDEVYNLMESCWAHDSSKRPNIGDLKVSISNIQLGKCGTKV